MPGLPPSNEYVEEQHCSSEDGYFDINPTNLHTTCPKHYSKRSSRQRLTGRDLHQRRQLAQHRKNIE